MNTELTFSLDQILNYSTRLELDMDAFSKGINNYHIDVRISPRFSSDMKKLAVLLIPQLAIPKPLPRDNSKLQQNLRTSYLDMMTVLLHRSSFDLEVQQVLVLQFAITKHILVFVKTELDKQLESIATRINELKHAGSASLLLLDKRLFWLRKNYSSILYEVNRQLFTQLKKVEQTQLASIRRSCLPQSDNYCVDALLNPLLFSNDLCCPQLLAKEYRLWSLNSQEADFIALNIEIEKIFYLSLSDTNTATSLTLHTPSKGLQGSTEIHDELGGLLASQIYLGIAADSKNTLTEELNCLELSDVLSSLFDLEHQSQYLEQLKKQQGFKFRVPEKTALEQRRKLLKDISNYLGANKLFESLLCSEALTKIKSSATLHGIDYSQLCQFVSGQINLVKLQQTNELNQHQITCLLEIQKSISKQSKKPTLKTTASIVVDLARFRRDLKLQRFSHRIFNRIRILQSSEDLALSKQANTLYFLPTGDEQELSQERIQRHCVLKADIRGSTTVIEDLLSRGLNPASYFSLRFFKPISDILENYGAIKVFHEGDALILSFLEFENSPQQWFCVSRACGLAREILRIVNLNNLYSKKMNLPLLELGIGICFSNKAPHYLYDDNRPIMISSAIGDADRISSCSWSLREQLDPRPFNVDVFKVDTATPATGVATEKGQRYLRYNVNGVLIDTAAFEKLQQELSLQTLSLEIDQSSHQFFTAEFPDIHGNYNDLVIRVGHPGNWHETEAYKQELEQDTQHRSPDESFYEVIVNQEIINRVLAAKTHKAAV
ncbi:MAG: hypothetical protein COC19_01955 [SAR86 cluster bacterium]|uniref:Guanylate cyclase domain-containing protein n=1 Tax=SAR86 cluster bacterium TaxID=2030880 RepID=A0A2A4MT40_9GAMM|nr:MAG: hypothetical protein COC19_01955 [SAR86 cluster bacterium]